VKLAAESSHAMGTKGGTYGISRSSGVVISLAAISLVTLLALGLATMWPSLMSDAIAVLIASVIIPVIALFKPLQEFTVMPDGLGFSTIFSKRVYKLTWTDVTDVRLKRDVFGITNLELRRNDKKIYKKVPLSIIPEHRELLRELLESVPSTHPTRGVLEHLVRSYVE